MALTLKQGVSHELVIKKSRFLSWLEPVESVSQAKRRVEELKLLYPDAGHVCFAYFVDGQTGLSDDGEPSGTAAKPMFNVLSHKALVNVLAVVVRYFGGIKLGAGGLSRAYGKAISEAVVIAELVPVERSFQISLVAPFALESQLRRVCDRFDLVVQNLNYRQQVEFNLTVPESQKAQVIAELQAVAPGDSGLTIESAP